MLSTEAVAARFADPRQVVAGALAEARVPARISISAAARERVLDNPGAYSGTWADSPHDTEMLDRPMDCLHADSAHREVVVMGPTQVGKSEIGNNWMGHTILHDPADMMFMAPSGIIDAYVKTQFTRMLDANPKMRARQLDGISADTIPLKQFRGCDFHFLGPSGQNFRSKPISRGRLDDYDDMPMDVGDQGDPLSLMIGRMGSFSAYGRTKVYVNSTPKLGTLKGIEGLVAQGTDERLFVDCLACDQPFELSSELLRYDDKGSPADASASACVVCPHDGCGGVHLQGDRRRLLATKRWVGKGETAIPGGKEGELLANSRASFRFDGIFGFRPWAEMAELKRSAEIKFEYEQDETALKAWWQTIAGRNYVAVSTGEPAVSEDALVARARAATYMNGEVPLGARCLIGAVDQQGNRFEVAIWAFGEGMRAWLVDRYQIIICGEEPLRPFTRPEHWAVLHEKVLARTWPVAGAPECRVKLLNLVVDTGGLDGATDNAFAWWHAMVKGDVGSGRAPVPPTAITLVKGGNNPKGKLLPPPTIDTKRQMKGAPQAELYLPNVNRMKDIMDVRLKRLEDGSGFIGFPRDIDRRYIAEMKAESKVGEQWVRAAHTANETGDLYIYACTALLRLGGGDASLGWVPVWARPPAPVVRRMPAPVAAGNDDDGPPPVEPMRRPTVQQASRRPPATAARQRVRMVRAG